MKSVPLLVVSLGLMTNMVSDYFSNWELISVTFADIVLTIISNVLSPICKCNIEDESTEHFLTRCPLFTDQRRILISNTSDTLRNDFSILPDDYVSRILLYGSDSFNAITNKLIIQSTIKYIRSTKRFNKLEAFSLTDPSTGTPLAQVWVVDPTVDSTNFTLQSF